MRAVRGPQSHEQARRDRFRLLFDANYEQVLGYAMRRAASHEDAADVVAETFLVAWRRLEELPPEAEVRLWLYGVARRVLANQRRGSARRHLLLRRVGEQQPPAAVEPGDGRPDAVLAALRRLRADDRELLRLAAWEGLDAAALATALGCSRGAARVRLHRARRRFAEELAALGVEVTEPLPRAAARQLAKENLA